MSAALLERGRALRGGCGIEILPLGGAISGTGCAVVLSVPQFIPSAANGHSRDIERAEMCQAVAYRRVGKIADVGDWRDAWDYQKWWRVEELADSRMFWRGVNALELQLDSWPTLSGDVVRAILAEALA